MTTSPPPDESDRPDPEQQPDDLSDPQAIEAAFDAIVAGIDQDTGGAPWPPAEGDPPADSPPKPTDVDRPVRTPRPDWEGWDDIRVPAPEPDDIDEPDERHAPQPPNARRQANACVQPLLELLKHPRETGYFYLQSTPARHTRSRTEVRKWRRFRICL